MKRLLFACALVLAAACGAYARTFVESSFGAQALHVTSDNGEVTVVFEATTRTAAGENVRTLQRDVFPLLSALERTQMQACFTLARAKALTAEGL